MHNLPRLGIGTRIGLFAGASMALLAALLLTGYAYKQKETIVSGEVKAARQLVLMAESVREQAAHKWELGVYSPEKLRKWAEQAKDREALEERVLDAVPIVNAWRAAQAKAEQGGFRFKPLRRNPRDEEHAPKSPIEKRALRHFEENPDARDFYAVDEAENAVRYFRPIHLSETCMNCHGDPARSEELWGRSDGRDLLGYKMEGWEEGELTGAFEVIRPLDQAEARLISNLWRSSGTALALLILAVGVLVWFIRRQICRPLHATIDNMQCIADHGDLSARLPSARLPEMKALADSFNRFVDSLSSTFRDYRSQTAQLASASEELSATAEEISGNAQASSQRVEQVSGSAQEVNNVVQDVANNIQEVSESANRTTQSTQQGKEAVDQAAERLDALKSSSSRVDEIIATIQDIAKKTDLLALNAAIEAANAGEHGKGFAVVADEVRQLAEQTSQATTQVNGIISEVRGHSDSSVEAMQQVQERMDEVLANIEHTDQSANQIAASAEELAATMGETTDNMGEISGSVDQVADSVVQIQDASQQLGDLASDLQHSLELYRLESSESAASTGGGVTFRKAKSDHLAWRTKLRDLLNGKASLSLEEATSHEHCRLGKWIYGEGLERYGHLQEMKHLESTHKALHQSIKAVIDHKNRGSAEEANREFARFQEYSEQVIADLDGMAARLE
ncbi:methyl-accepting chemotaxis protein [Thiohalorhabdus sp. Cl-TMA]|uniref:Methyl-accepting chemotaxis protein n=1 Tax=Thiohalorhabdus methylotrophus TaxID=3242694 RepID=A0ABV4TQB0_9GAMM